MATSTLSGVTPDSLQRGLLRGVLGLALFNPADTDLQERLTEAIADAEATIQADLSTRFALTSFQGWMGPDAAAALDQANGPQEWEPPYAWPPSIPGDNFPRWRTHVRPVVSFTALTIIMPGGIQTRIDVPPQWCRMDHVQGEVMVAPSLFNAPLQSGGLTGPLILGLGGRQMPMSVLLAYTAGLGPDGMTAWPQVKRLVELQAAIRLLPDLASMMNPGVFTSESADGLTQSRSSGYVFKDLEERLGKELEDRKTRLLDLWDGPGAMMVL